MSDIGMNKIKSFHEYQLEEKSGASSRGNSSANRKYKRIAVKKLVVGLLPTVGPCG